MLVEDVATFPIELNICAIPATFEVDVPKAFRAEVSDFEKTVDYEAKSGELARTK